ncbi:tetratricopeptide repeat protein [Haliscomenobacter sp.]|uniref:tetratricopeptide repeat protein n=1 Tax=Haliscomenobacter sp. TaxID=2717303 RepID=UPI003592F555
MNIFHKLDDFLFTIFPDLIIGGGNSLIINKLEEYYSYGPFKPKVEIKDGWVNIEIDTPTILNQEADYRKTIALCEKGNYAEAKIILEKLIEKNPTNSEYHRIRGQIFSDQGHQEQAIDSLIDALRWDPKNSWALLMMGNIFAKFKNDLPTAMRYYDQALIVNPNDNITVNNIGANLLQQGKLEEAKKYFLKAVKIDDQYPNTHFALGIIAEMEDDLFTAFLSTVQAIKVNKKKDGLYQNSVKQAFDFAKKIVETDAGRAIYQDYFHKLEREGKRKIEIHRDDAIPTAAKFEFAENYDRPNHTLRYKSNYPAVEHLIMHELVHLDLVIEARKEELNQLFISKKEHKTLFIKGLEQTIKKLSKMGVADQMIADYCSSLFEGMNRQAFNAPVDLFIENFLYKQYPKLRPYQFISLYNLLQESLKAVTDKRIVELSPKDILSKSKVYNVVNALQFRDLFGLDFIKDFQTSPSELKQANQFYEEYLQYKDDKEPAEEYELILHWAEDLKLDKYFELVNESEYRNKRTSIDNSVATEATLLNNDTKDQEIKRFEQSQQAMGTNMAVVMFMVEALQFFEKMPQKQVKEIAFEIAMKGAQGFSTDGNDYRIALIPDKVFSGYHILAYYYVSWALAIPDMLIQLQLPYDGEYQVALTIFKPNKP